MSKLLPANIVKVDLPSSTAEDPAWVKLDLSLNAGLSVLLASSPNKGEAIITSLASIITTWSFADDKGKMEPITVDSVRRMHPEDFDKLCDLLTNEFLKQQSPQVDVEEKKT